MIVAHDAWRTMRNCVPGLRDTEQGDKAAKLAR
eukprot:CAMPEP_0180823808 /NCGR_PEP_ID=MMETSP1038_2-20121128/72101_1 /TAXON_ID=632150 /ORGANISM="Azadinium spinosum, Strain 3D9" /LENGTH=32 /DNA_ID= /DNA_START= /DNA_END= /DNA_ORIENTATION=